MIHYFNPGHEAAVLNGSKHYQAAGNQVRMQRDLAFLPAWYARPGDWVWVEDGNTLWEETGGIHPCARPLSIDRLADRRDELIGQSIDLWGLSPQSIHRFEQINRQYGLGWQIPVWKEELRSLGSRNTALQVLRELIKVVPELGGMEVPRFVSGLEEMEGYLNEHPGRWLVKSPFSSSGRGLVWLPSGSLARSERQIVSGMLKKQSQVSIEPMLDKALDFSMHFEIDAGQAIRFVGYSIFQTNEKGAYTSSKVAAQETLENQIHAFIDEMLLSRVKNRLLPILQKTYAPHYRGNLGVDMLAYRTENGSHRLHPCIEINMRKSMGWLAIELHRNYLHAETQGCVRIDYCPSSDVLRRHLEMRGRYPAVIEGGRMVSGYLGLCPMGEMSVYRAYLVCGDFLEGG
jgi:hypothetical protein